MVSKKDALILGIALIGGLGAATMLAGDAGDAGAGAAARAIPGGILGAPTGAAAAAAAPTVYQFAAQPAVTFPKAPAFDIGKIIPKPEPKKDVYDPAAYWGAFKSRGLYTGKPAAPVPYLYTGGEIKPGAVSVAPWAMSRTTPSEIGVTTALKYARGTPKKEIVT